MKLVEDYFWNCISILAFHCFTPIKGTYLAYRPLGPLVITLINQKMMLTLLVQLCFDPQSRKFNRRRVNKMNLSLTSLPPELICEILHGATRSYLILDLWKCGDRTLNSKLAIGITNVGLSSRSLRRPISFPTLIYQLRSLRVLCVSMSGSKSEQPLDLKSLPQTLERLEFNSIEGHTSFFNYAPNYPAAGPKYIETNYPRGRSRLIDLNALFPRLLTLKLTRPATIQLPFVETDFAALPATLTCLQVVEIKSTGHLMRCLPRTLQRIEGQVTWTSDIGSALDWQSAPSTLEYIHCLSFSHTEDTARGLRHVPKSLRCDNITFSQWNQTLASSVPDNLHRIYVNQIDDESFSNTNWVLELPKGLEDLSTVFPRRFSSTSAIFLALSRTWHRIMETGDLSKRHSLSESSIHFGLLI